MNRCPKNRSSVWAASSLLACASLALTLSCPSSPQAGKGRGPEELSQPGPGSRRDLSLDESAGGHTLRRHVGRSDEQLLERLDEEPDLSAASTYTDRQSAELAVGTALDASRGKLDRWLERAGGHPNLVLDYDGDSAHPIGRTLRRGQTRSEPCSQAIVVLRWRGPGDYYVLTSYPECRS
jgi:hypothetical protein